MPKILTRAPAPSGSDAARSDALVADIIIANAPDPVFISDLEGKILQVNHAVSAHGRTNPRSATSSLDSRTNSVVRKTHLGVFA
jgi:hypothetical protein